MLLTWLSSRVFGLFIFTVGDSLASPVHSITSCHKLYTAHARYVTQRAVTHLSVASSYYSFKFSLGCTCPATQSTLGCFFFVQTSISFFIYVNFIFFASNWWGILKTSILNVTGVNQVAQINKCVYYYIYW